MDTPHNAVIAAGNGQLFVGTDFGVWESLDDGLSWGYEGPADGLPNVAIHDLHYSPATRQLMAYTHGRGAFLRRVDVPVFADGFESGDTTAWSNTVP